MSKVRTLDYMLPFKGTLKKDPGVKNIYILKEIPYGSKEEMKLCQC